MQPPGSNPSGRSLSRVTQFHGMGGYSSMADSSQVIATFFGDGKFPVEWKNEEEKKLHWFYDDLHIPHPVSPMYFDVGGWWGPTCKYMYRRFGVPFGQNWIAKKVGGYVYSAVVPREPADAARIGPYFNMVMPVYAGNFLKWWNERYLPEMKANLEYLDTWPYDQASLPELMVHLEDALDIQERHFRIHWQLNLAQFASFLGFRAVYKEAFGQEDEEEIGKILVSVDDRNWDSLRVLWEIKEQVKANPDLRAAFSRPAVEIPAALDATEAGRAVRGQIDAYRVEFGNRAMYTHEYIYRTWREDPTPIYEALKGYLDSDYNFPAALERTAAERERAIARMMAQVPDGEQKDRLSQALDLALKMAPLTPDHHFYIDQGTYARVRQVFLGVGRGLVRAGILDNPEDILYLEYEELRTVAANPQAFDARALAAGRREECAAAARTTPRDWVGTITHWSLYEEPYKTLWHWPNRFLEAEQKAAEPVGVVKGLAASPGEAEGVARVVNSPAEFDQVQEGEIVVCRMTNPAWAVVFSKIGALVTDAGGMLSHPAVVAREFGIPAVTGTGHGTRRIQTGQRVRVNGSAGTVDILG